MESYNASKLLLPLAIELGLRQGCLESASEEEASDNMEPEEPSRHKKVTGRRRPKSNQKKGKSKIQRKGRKVVKWQRGKAAKASAKRKKVYKDLLREIKRKMKRNANRRRSAANHQEDVSTTSSTTSIPTTNNNEGNNGGETKVPDTTGSDTEGSTTQ